MNIQIKSTNIKLTQAIGDYVHKKFESLDKFLRDVPADTLCYVDVGKTTRHHKNGDVYRADVNLNYDGKKLYACAETEDLYSAIDELKDELGRELKTVREKKQAETRKGRKMIKEFVKGIKLF
jgi:ribosomal subunit interface protein